MAGAGLVLAAMSSVSLAQDGPEPIKSRNVEVSRVGATPKPRSEGDQALANGWPLYRTPRGQIAFNDAMATLKATDGAAPAQASFRGCVALQCALELPSIGPDGWIPAGRIWISQSEYVLIVHSPRSPGGRGVRRHSPRSMRVFVFHEFHSSSRNVDPYDTISSHSGSVFVPFYMSRQGTDAKGRRFVVVVQVSPYDVDSIHATNHDSAGPGMEVAKNADDELQPLQGLAGILVASIVKAAAPQLRVVNHHGNEGLPMLRMYDDRLAGLSARPGVPIRLPFVPAIESRLAQATAPLGELIARAGVSRPIPVAERAIVPARLRSAEATAADGNGSGVPVLVEPVRRAVRPTTR